MQEGSGTEQPFWQLICRTSTKYNHPLEKEYYFTDEGRLRFLRENVGSCTIIELDDQEAFVSWEQTDWLPEDGLGWELYTCVYDENGDILDGDWHGQA